MLNILVVDDNIDAAESLMEIIVMEGHKVTICLGGGEALEEYSRDEFQLVFIDLKMPEMAGGEVIKRLFAMDRTARIAVITGNTVQEEIEEVEKLGVLEIIRKPIDPMKLLEMIENEDLSKSGSNP